MQLSPIENKIKEIITPAIEAIGFRLVTLRIEGGGADAKGGQSLVIMAEREEDGRLGIDDCAKISREISALLDVEDPINGAYRLEVSSPGIDRPLVCLEDFDRFKDQKIRLEVAVPVDGRRRFKGVNKGIDDGGDFVVLELDGKVDPHEEQEDATPVRISLANIRRASLDIAADLLKPKEKPRHKRTHKRNKKVS